MLLWNRYVILAKWYLSDVICKQGTALLFFLFANKRDFHWKKTLPGIIIRKFVLVSPPLIGFFNYSVKREPTEGANDHQQLSTRSASLTAAQQLPANPLHSDSENVAERFATKLSFLQIKVWKINHINFKIWLLLDIL